MPLNYIVIRFNFTATLTRGFSYIQLAEDLKTKQHYAVKRLLAQEADQVAQIKDEVRVVQYYTFNSIQFQNLQHTITI